MAAYIDIRVTGGNEEINELILLLSKIQYLGEVGAGRTIPVVVDGDGSGALRFSAKDGTGNEVFQQAMEIIRSGKILNGDREPFEDQVDDVKIEKHYIGE